MNSEEGTLHKGAPYRRKHRKCGEIPACGAGERAIGGNGIPSIPPIEFGTYTGAFVISPVISLSSVNGQRKSGLSGRTFYTLDIAFAVPEGPELERNCYACAYTMDRALREDPALGGAASRAELTGRKYNPPKCSGTGEGWELVLSLRVTVEEMTNAD